MKLDRVIAWRLAEHAHRVAGPLRYELLERWIRLQWPAVLPQAVGTVLCRLAAVGLVEADDRGWFIRPPQSRQHAARAHRNGWNPQGRAG